MSHAEAIRVCTAGSSALALCLEIMLFWMTSGLRQWRNNCRFLYSWDKDTTNAGSTLTGALRGPNKGVHLKLPKR